MSNADLTVTKEAAEQAYGTLLQRAYMPVFFNKLAAAGIEPANEKQAESLLSIAYKLREHAAAETVKQANSADDVFALFDAELGGAVPDKTSDMWKAAAADAALDADLAAAALALQVAAAQSAAVAN